MSGVAEVIAGAIEGLADVGYGIYQDQRDFNYQKQLNQQIFDREDNAVQRKVADLKAAGLSPVLAAGSSAGSGGSVSSVKSKDISSDVAGNILQMKGLIAQQDKIKQEVAESKARESYYNKLASKTEEERIGQITANEVADIDKQIKERDNERGLQYGHPQSIVGQIFSDMYPWFQDMGKATNGLVSSGVNSVVGKINEWSSERKLKKEKEQEARLKRLEELKSDREKPKKVYKRSKFQESQEAKRAKEDEKYNSYRRGF